VSLDFILVKSHGHPLEMSEIAEDTAFKRSNYAELAERLSGLSCRPSSPRSRLLDALVENKGDVTTWQGM
jgi:hypothetical protein